MANNMRDLQDILFAEIDNIKQASQGSSTAFSIATRRASAVNETARTIISAGDLVLQATVQASMARKGGHALDGSVIQKLTGISDENAERSIGVSSSQQDKA